MKTGFKKRLFLVLAGTMVAGIAFAGGFYWGRSRVQCDVCPPQEVNFSLFWEAYHKIKEKYVAPEEIREEDILYGAISGMTRALEDPYTLFMKPEDTDRFLEDISGQFEGVGMEIGIREGVLQVIAPLEGTPADRAGIRAGDKILEVDGESTSGLSLEEVVTRIRGPKGTPVILTIRRKDWDASREIEIVRDEIEIPSLRWERMNENGEKDPAGKIAYIKIYHFTQRVGLDFAKAAVQIKSSSVDRIILDLRNNPGGYLEMSRDIAGYFLNRGQVVVIEDSGEKEEEFKAQGTPLFRDYPVVVLINEGSASASEILAGALQAHRKVLLVGTKSFGKGSVQELLDLRGGSSLKVTVAKWLTPGGRTIEEEGLEPDIKVEMTEKDYEAGTDPQLERAVEIISD